MAPNRSLAYKTLRTHKAFILIPLIFKQVSKDVKAKVKVYHVGATIEAPHDVPADQNTEIEIGKQHSKRELKNMREKNRYHKEKANRRENQIELKKLQEDIHRLYAYINANHPTGPQNEEWQQATTSHQVSPSIPKLACSGRNWGPKEKKSRS